MSSNIFTDEKISKSYIRLSLPLVFSLVVTLIYNLADTFFVAQTNNTDIVTGVSLGAPIFTLLMAFGNIFGQGGSSVISRYLGQNNLKKIRNISAFCFYTAILVGLATLAVMLVIRRPMVWLLGASESSYSHAMDYYTWLAIGAPVIILSFIHSNLLRSEGLSKESMAGTILGAVVNIVLDPLFISTFGLGAGGAAIATDIGYLCTDVFLIYIVRKRSRILSINPRECKIAGHDNGQILKIGIPAAITNVMTSVSVVVMNQFLLAYGNEKIAAMGIAMKVSMIVTLLLTGFTFGGQPLYGYYYGAGNHEKLKELFLFSLRFILLLALVLSVVVFAAAPWLMRIFIANPQIIKDGAQMLRWQVLTMIFVGIVFLFTIIFQSFGKALGSFILSISRQGVIYLAVLLIAKHMAEYKGIISAQAISDVITAVIAFFLFQKELRQEFFVSIPHHAGDAFKKRGQAQA